MIKLIFWAMVLPCFVVHANPRGNFATGNKIVLAAFGDSITKAMNTDRWGDQPANSWSTGNSNEVHSIAYRLKELYPESELAVFNAARSGARVDDILRQLETVIPQHPDFVTFLMGANDLCTWGGTPAEFEHFLKIVDDTFSQLVSANPQIKILLAPIPDMNLLRKLGQQNGQCQQVWDLFKICPNLLSSRRTSRDHEQFVLNWETLNRSLREVAMKYPQVTYREEASRTRFNVEHVSTKDCFHPSIKGQRLIADSVWTPDWAASF